MGCNICPRRCNANRKTGNGYCGCNDKITVNRFAPHFWEEPCISGNNGAGNIFLVDASYTASIVKTKPFLKKQRGKLFQVMNYAIFSFN
jgi:hypothetical protein